MVLLFVGVCVCVCASRGVCGVCVGGACVYICACMSFANVVFILMVIKYTVTAACV